MISTSRKIRLVPKFNPTSSPRLRGTSYLGKAAHEAANPNGVVSLTTRRRHNPVGVENILGSVTQGSSFLATQGCVTESRWDCEAGTEAVFSA
ncbi:MAG: hypothetical protein HOP33_13825 [Verrucomicrobia bacterium]|nr:hypothetical protein [Verrucomicrobiota bacterium]